jgi:septal ring factor EnvC (AmiA/AmiB activator)
MEFTMRTHTVIVPCAIMLALGMPTPGMAGPNAPGASSARQVLQSIHSPRSIDQELARLTTDLELTRDQQQKVRARLQQHHDKIQALLDRNRTATRQQLSSQIHAISDETHREIHALLSPRQQQLEKQMQQREQNGQEFRRPR